MVTPRPIVAEHAAEHSGQTAVLSERTVRSERQPRRSPPLTRRYEVAYLTDSGFVEERTCIAPATPAFEDAFAALVRGALIATENGMAAIEDLCPGVRVRTGTGELMPIRWIGSMTLVPEAAEFTGGMACRLTRIASDSFGIGRPGSDMLLGPRARVLYRSNRCREMLGTSQAFAPARAFVDGINVVDVTPVAPIRMYHLALDGQQSIFANGIEVESFHPGPQIEAMMDRASLDLFLSLFPQIDSADGFGPVQTPRLTAFELDALRNG